MENNDKNIKIILEITGINDIINAQTLTTLHKIKYIYNYIQMKGAVIKEVDYEL